MNITLIADKKSYLFHLHAEFINHLMLVNNR